MSGWLKRRLEDEWLRQVLVPAVIAGSVAGGTVGYFSGKTAAPHRRDWSKAAAAGVAPDDDREAWLQVTSAPPDARVTLDGRVVGRTPIERLDVDPGTHAVVLDLKGFEPWTHSVRVAGGTVAKVRATLKVTPLVTVTAAPPALAPTSSAAPAPPPRRHYDPPPRRPTRNCSSEKSDCENRCWHTTSYCEMNCFGCGSCTSDKTPEQCKMSCDSCRVGCKQNDEYCKSACQGQYDSCNQQNSGD